MSTLAHVDRPRAGHDRVACTWNAPAGPEGLEASASRLREGGRGRTTRGHNDGQRGGLPLSQHARMRVGARGLSVAGVDAALAYGRIVRARGAVIYMLGRKAVDAARRLDGLELGRHEGVHVVTVGTTIVTVYRNHDFKLRPRRRRSVRRRR